MGTVRLWNNCLKWLFPPTLQRHHLISSACWFFKLSAMAQEKEAAAFRSGTDANFCLSAGKALLFYAPELNAFSCKCTEANPVQWDGLAWTRNITGAGQAAASQPVSELTAAPKTRKTASILIDPSCSWALIGPAFRSHVLRYRPCWLLYRVKTQCGHFDG